MIAPEGVAELVIGHLDQAGEIGISTGSSSAKAPAANSSNDAI